MSSLGLVSLWGWVAPRHPKEAPTRRMLPLCVKCPHLAREDNSSSGIPMGLVSLAPILGSSAWCSRDQMWCRKQSYDNPWHLFRAVYFAESPFTYAMASELRGGSGPTDKNTGSGHNDMGWGPRSTLYMLCDLGPFRALVFLLEKWGKIPTT